MYKIQIRITGSQISNQMRHVNTICRRLRHVTVEKEIVDDRKVKIVTFMIKFGSQGSINVMLEVKVRVGS